MRYRIVLLSFILIVGMVVWAGADSFWPMFQRDPGHTGLAPVSTADNLQLLWQVDVQVVQPAMGAHLVMGNDGCIWVVGAEIMAVSPDGRVEVEFRFPANLAGSFRGDPAPVVLADGTLVVLAHVKLEGLFKPHLFAIEPRGALRWTLPLDGLAGDSLLTLGPAGEIYAASDKYLYRVSQEPQIRWSYDCGSKITTLPAVAQDGSVYFAAYDKALYCLSSQGLLKWTFQAVNRIVASPTVDANGRVYFVVSGAALYCLNDDASVHFAFPSYTITYASPVLLPDGSVVFIGATIVGYPGYEAICVGADGQLRWKLGMETNQTPMTSPAADAEGNVYIGYFVYEGEPPNYVFHRRLARISPTASYEEFDVETGGSSTTAGGFCIGPDGTVYGYNGNLLCAFGSTPESLNLGVSTWLSAFDAHIGWTRAASIQIANPRGQLDQDCYMAYRRQGSDQLFFYPFWSNDPIGCALEFRPLPAGAQFPKIELIHLQERGFEPGQYEWLAGLFEPGTFNPLCGIASCDFTVYPQPTGGYDLGFTKQGEAANASGVQATPPTISIWTEKASYSTGEILDLSLSFENQGLGMPLDLYIAAQLDADPSGTL
ncbi:MAG: PQQ-like beta-propeller repeat protein, partial [Candidatus Coatesbacteria bacterium]|nr:PQQ-like beta-propeller repeat protein [Candidatus Coatesbacteria bacterium]